MNFEVIYPKNLSGYLREHPAVLIDVRTRKEYDEDHWTGALSFPYEEAERWEKRMPGNRVLVFYCAHGGNSMQIARRLGLLGYRTATVIGGYAAMTKWK